MIRCERQREISPGVCRVAPACASEYTVAVLSSALLRVPALDVRRRDWSRSLLDTSVYSREDEFLSLERSRIGASLCGVSSRVSMVGLLNQKHLDTPRQEYVHSYTLLAGPLFDRDTVSSLEIVSLTPEIAAPTVH